MSSSDGTGSVGKSATRKTGPAKTAARRIAARKSAAKAETPARGPHAHDDGVTDPWFGPGPKVAYVDSGLAEPDGHTVQGEWFLPTGRAGLLPGSMTESWDDDGTALAERAKAAGAPPWGRDGAAAAAGEPPPWETGPWPGPGESADRPRPVVADPGAHQSVLTDLALGTESRQRSRLIMIGGAAVLVVVVMIVVIVVVTSGGPGGCATYPAAVRQAYAKAMSDLSSRAPASVQTADLDRAASLANMSAVRTGQITARTALFTMAGDLDEASFNVARHRPITLDLQQRLTADGTALPQSC